MLWGVIGLSLDIVGVVVIGIPATRFVSWPVIGRIGSSKELKKAKSELFSEQRIEDDSKHFDTLIEFTESERGKFDRNQTPKKITSGPRWDVGMTVAVIYDEDGDEYTDVVAPVAVFDNWIENKIERAYLKWGLAFVSLGFALQIVNMIV